MLCCFVKIILMEKTCEKSFMNYDWTQSLCFAIIQKPMENPIGFLSREPDNDFFHANCRSAYGVTS